MITTVNYEKKKEKKCSEAVFSKKVIQNSIGEVGQSLFWEKKKIWLEEIIYNKSIFSFSKIVDWHGMLIKSQVVELKKLKNFKPILKWHSVNSSMTAARCFYCKMKWLHSNFRHTCTYFSWISGKYTLPCWIFAEQHTNNSLQKEQETYQWQHLYHRQ